MNIRGTTLSSPLAVAILVIPLGAAVSSAAVILPVKREPVARLPRFAIYNGTMYLSYASPTGEGDCRGPTGYAPCFVYTKNLAVVFNCASEAASPSGCTTKVVSPLMPEAAYQITIWYPVVGQPGETSSENCKWTTSGNSGQYFFYSTCISINSTSFIATETPSGTAVSALPMLPFTLLLVTLVSLQLIIRTIPSIRRP